MKKNKEFVETKKKQENQSKSENDDWNPLI